MFLLHRLQNRPILIKADTALIVLNIYLPQNIINVFNLTEIMHLHYLVKVKIRVFVKILTLEK